MYTEIDTHNRKGVVRSPRSEPDVTHSDTFYRRSIKIVYFCRSLPNAHPHVNFDNRWRGEVTTIILKEYDNVMICFPLYIEKCICESICKKKKRRMCVCSDRGVGVGRKLEGHILWRV